MIQSEIKVIHNFNSGPSILPKEVFEQASHAIIDFNNTGYPFLNWVIALHCSRQVMDEARIGKRINEAG